MIIECINCSKVFEVNSELIPKNGRNIQCGSCNHVWFYNPKISNFKKEKNQDTKIDNLKETFIEENRQKVFEEKDYSKLKDKKIMRLQNINLSLIHISEPTRPY